MRNRIEVLKKIEETGIIAVIRLSDDKKLGHLVDALAAGGVNLIEITFTIPNAIEVIRKLTNKVDDGIIVGAGSVLDTETARAAILAGAEFIVSPIMNTDVIRMAHRYDKVCIPGGFSPTEITTAWENGADVVKVFPATAMGPQFFKDIHGPLPHIKLTPTGGVCLDNAADFIKAGACCIGVGTALLDKQMVADSDWAGITRRASQFIQAVVEGRK